MSDSLRRTYEERLKETKLHQSRSTKVNGYIFDAMLLTNINIKARPVQALTFLGRGSSLVMVNLKGEKIRR